MGCLGNEMGLTLNAKSLLEPVLNKSWGAFVHESSSEASAWDQSVVSFYFYFFSTEKLDTFYFASLKRKFLLKCQSATKLK